MMVERHLRGREVADLLGVSEDTVLRLAHRGDIVSVRVGTQRRYPESAVNAYLRRNVIDAADVNVVPLARNAVASTTRRTA